MVPLTGVMKQRADYNLVTHLDKIRVDQTNVELFLKLKFLNIGGYFQHALNMFAEHIPGLNENEIRLIGLDTRLVSITAIDEIPKDLKPIEVQTEAINQSVES